MTREQWQLILDAVEANTKIYAHQPELNFDVVPTNGVLLAALQADWYISGLAAQLD